MNPLDQLRDVHQPPPPGWWPPGPGWWLLAALLVCALLAGSWWLYRRYQRRAYRRAALAELAQLTGQGREHARADQNVAAELFALVRRTARAGNPSSDWPGLGARELLERIDRASGQRFSTELQAEGCTPDELAENQYRPHWTPSSAQGVVISRWCAWWIRHHREADLC